MPNEIHEIQLLKDINRHWGFILKIRDLTPPERKKVLTNMDERLKFHYMKCAWDKDNEEILRIIGINERIIEKWIEENLELPKFVNS